MPGTPLTPNATRLVLLGSGELGREVAVEAIRLGCEVLAVDRYPDAPAMQVAQRSAVVDMTDADALRAEEVRAPIGPLTGEPAYRIVPVGGNVRILSQLEWEFAITPKIGGWPWVGALFLDTGAVSDGFSRLKWNDVRFSVGISLVRLLTQFGALSLDYAYPLVMPGQESLVQSDRWKREAWYAHFPGRIHFNWGMPISL